MHGSPHEIALEHHDWWTPFSEAGASICGDISE